MSLPFSARDLSPVAGTGPTVRLKAEHHYPIPWPTSRGRGGAVWRKLFGRPTTTNWRSSRMMARFTRWIRLRRNSARPQSRAIAVNRRSHIFRGPVQRMAQRSILATGGVAPDGMSAATELRVFDTATWTQVGRVRTSVPFWSAVAGPDGTHIYAVAPAQHRVLVIDARTLQEERGISVGNAPSLAIVAP